MTLLIPPAHILCWDLIGYPKRYQFETLDAFPACLQKQGTFCAKYGFTGTLLVRCITNLRSWSSQLSILIFQVQIPLHVTCNFIEEGMWLFKWWSKCFVGMYAELKRWGKGSCDSYRADCKLQRWRKAEQF